MENIRTLRITAVLALCSLLLAACMEIPTRKTGLSGTSADDGGMDGGENSGTHGEGGTSGIDGSVEPVPCNASMPCTKPEASYCNPGIQHCFPCRGDQDCPASLFPGLTRCLPETRCVECTENNHCNAGEVCSANNKCVECLSNNGCADREDAKTVCSPQGKCVACAQNEDCTTPEAARCDLGSYQCSECQTSEHCAHFGDSYQCKDGKCVQCSSNDDCMNEEASYCDAGKCVPCSPDADNTDGIDEQCRHLSNTPACVNGTCQECAAGKITRCKVGDEQFICDPSQNKCSTTRKAGSKNACDECISNDECKDGFACADDAAGAGSHVCLKVFTGIGSCDRPRVKATGLLPTADGEDQRVCTFAVSTTTCQAHRDYRNKLCGIPMSEDNGPHIPNSGDDSKCGVEGQNDGYCILSEGLGQYRCTVPCNNDEADCPVDAPSCSNLQHASGQSRFLCEQ